MPLFRDARRIVLVLLIALHARGQDHPFGRPRVRDLPPVQVLRVDEAFTFSNPLFAPLPNGQTYTQDTLLTFKGWQYLGYWDANRNLALARRKVPSLVWERIVFTDYQTLGQDAHRSVSVGICPNDGTIHLSFDHHSDPLKYRRSVRGPALHPEAFTWSASLFGPVIGTLDPSRGPLSYVTYPRFIQTPSGNLQFVYREFGGGNKNVRIVDYDATTGTWSGDRQVTEGSGSHTDPLAGTSSFRRAYINRIDYDRFGTLHMTWTWREIVPASLGGYTYNRDICYAYSEDEGHVWYSATHQQVADVDAGWVIDGTSPVVVVSLPAAWGLLNDQAQIVDDRGRVHVVMYHKDQPSTQVSFANVFNSHYYHYWGEADGTWNCQMLPWIGDRPKMIADGDGRLFLTHRSYSLPAPGVVVDMATPGYDYLDWQRVLSVPGPFGTTAHVDRPLFRQTGLMSIPMQESPSTPGASSWLDVIDIVSQEVFPEPRRITKRTRRRDLVTEQDAYVRNGAYATANFGAAPVVRVQNSASPDDQRLGFLRFYFAPLTGEGAVVSATLLMKAVGTGPAWQPAQLGARRCAQDVWFENGITWANRPQPAATAPTYPAQTVGAGMVAIDLTEMVQTELRAGGERLTVELSQTSTNPGSWVELEALEAQGDLAPTLVIMQENVLVPVADAYVRGGAHGASNHGGETCLAAGEDANPDYDRLSYLRFDLAGVAGTGTIRKVYLDLDSPLMGSHAATTPYVLRFVGDDTWQEGSITWNNRPALGASLAVHFGRPRLRFDVTSQVLAEAAGDGMLSLAIESSREGAARAIHLWSREAGAARGPRLLIDYD